MIHLKLPNEIVRLRSAAELVGKTLGEVAKYVKPGVTTLELDAIAEDYIRTRNGRPAFKGYPGTNPENPFPGTLCLSVNDVVVHGIPSTYVLQEGDILSVDCGAELDGYFGDFAYTFAIGEISEDKRELLKVTAASLFEGIDRARVGNRVGDIGYAVQNYCESRGFGVVKELVGHGVGRELHEEPQVPNHGKRGDGKKMKEGLTICIEPMINAGTEKVKFMEDGWTVKTEDGKAAAHYEHMVCIRRGAPEVISMWDYIEEVVTPPYK
ncbi:MAG: type I methionyl aminopeptidase [Bacteroidetes Order II. Incertae sedis bacterium]|nr:type I methionyl aminopeptidase [Bacteroidetes Order II. bacterium]